MNTLASWNPGSGFVIAVLDILLVVACMVAAAWAADRVFARHRPALRSSIWHSALAGVLLAPALCLIGVRLPWHIGVLATENASLSSQEFRETEQPAVLVNDFKAPALVRGESGEGLAAPVRRDSEPKEIDSHVGVSALPLDERDAAPRNPAMAEPVSLRKAMPTAIFLVWAFGSLCLVARLLHGWLRVRRLQRRSSPVSAQNWLEEIARVAGQLSLRQAPDLCTSSMVGSPMLIGLFRPRLLIPEALVSRATSKQIKDICTHECAHLARRDPWTRILQRLTVILYWMHPLVHLLNRRLNQAREEVCDNFVLRHADAAEYAETLLVVAQLSQQALIVPGYLTILPRRQILADRVAGLLDERRDRAIRPLSSQRAMLAAAILLVFVALSSIGLQPNARAQTGTTQNKPQQNLAADSAGRVKGMVVNDADNKPVAGAKVWLIATDGTTYVDDEPKQETKTNARGEFAFEGIAPGKYRVVSTLGNLSSRLKTFRGEDVVVAQEGSSKSLTLKMSPGISVRVRVLSQVDGKPIPGAHVRTSLPDLDQNRVTDSQGEMVVEALSPRTWELEATAPGFARETVSVDLNQKQTAIREFHLARGGSVEGQVLNEQVQPVPGVELVIGDSERVPSQTMRVRLKADAKGRYQCDFLPLDRNLYLLVRRNTTYLDVSKTFLLDAGHRKLAGVNLILKKLPPRGAIHGVVTGRDGKPVVGAEVINNGGSSIKIRRTKTDAEGRFTLADVFAFQPGTVFLTVRASGYSPKQVELEEKPDQQIEMKLEPGHRIQGRVVDEAGKPISGAYVMFRLPREFVMGAEVNQTRTNSEGRFQFDSLTTAAQFAVGREGYVALNSLRLPLDGDKEVEVTLKPLVLAAIKGRVLDAATQEPVRQFNVRIAPVAGGGGLLASRNPMITTNRGVDFSSSSGEFVLNDLAQGARAQVTISAEGYQRLVERSVETTTDAAARPIEFRMTKIDSSKLFALSGKLVDHKNEPIRAANVVLIVTKNRPSNPYAPGYGWPAIETRGIDQAPAVLQVQRKATAQDGSFHFTGVPADAEVELAYWSKGFPRDRKDNLQKLTEKERTNLVIKTLAPARIVGTIDRQVFPAVPGLLPGINLFSPGRQFANRRPGDSPLSADGKSFAFEDLAPGQYTIQIMGPGIAQQGKRAGTPVMRLVGRKTVTLKEGEEAKVTLGEADKIKREQP